MTRARTSIAAMIVWAAFLARGPLAAANPIPDDPPATERTSALPDYVQEGEFLVDTPGTSGSAAAGLFNPAAWAIQNDGSLFVGWRDLVGLEDDAKDWMAVLSRRQLAFAMRRFQLQDAEGRGDHLDEYTIGFSGGDRAAATGISYSWNRGGGDLMPRHRRLSIGVLRRWSRLSCGGATAFDLERQDYTIQADLGLRLLGPRLTLFGDALYRDGDDFEDISTGFGLEAYPLAGVCLAAKMRDDGDFSLRVELNSQGHLRSSARMHFDDDGDHFATTYAFEVGPPRPVLGHGLFGRRQLYPELDLRGPTVYRRYRFLDDRRTLMRTLQRINAYAEDPHVGGLVLNLSGMQMSGELLWEVREQLAGLRSRGKKVVVYLDYVGMGGYMLASVADQIWMDPQGFLSLRGITAGRTYYRNAFDKIGVGIEEFRYFTYKSAMEGLARRSMSDADREQRQEMIDDIYATIAETVTAARGISPRDWDRVIDEQGEVMAAEAQAAGLVDSLGSYEDAKQSARKAAPRTTAEVSTLDLAGVTGDPVWGTLEWGEPARIAVLYAVGECAMDSGIKGRQLSKEIEAARKDRRIKAIVLRADSPGGEPLPSDLVARELLEASKSKPVIVSQGQVAASGGYWISMNADSIVASPFTLTGSIGVIGGMFWNEGIGDRLGMGYDHVKRGEHADVGRGLRLPLVGLTIPDRPLTEYEHKRAEHLIRTLYADFVAKVAEGRGMSPARVDEVGQGRIWMGARAKGNGLVDELGGLWTSLRIAKERAGLGPADRVVYVEGPSLGFFNFGALLRPSPLESAQRLLGSDTARTPLSPELLPEEGPWSLGSADSQAQKLLGTTLFGMLSPADQMYCESLLRAQGKPLVITPPVELQLDPLP